MNFVAFENTLAIAACPAPSAAYCSGHAVERALEYVHAIAARCSRAALIP